MRRCVFDYVTPQQVYRQTGSITYHHREWSKLTAKVTVTMRWWCGTVARTSVLADKLSLSHARPSADG